MSSEKTNINDNILKVKENILIRDTDFINKGRKRNNNKNFDENYKISKTIRTKKKITDSIARKKAKILLIRNWKSLKMIIKKNYNGNNNYNINQVNNFAQKNSNKLILNRGINIKD